MNKCMMVSIYLDGKRINQCFVSASNSIKAVDLCMAELLRQKTLRLDFNSKGFLVFWTSLRIVCQSSFEYLKFYSQSNNLVNMIFNASRYKDRKIWSLVVQYDFCCRLI